MGPLSRTWRDRLLGTGAGATLTLRLERKCPATLRLVSRCRGELRPGAWCRGELRPNPHCLCVLRWERYVHCQGASRASRAPGASGRSLCVRTHIFFPDVWL